MFNKILTALFMIVLIDATNAQTINNLGAGSAVSGTDLFPSYQGANPAKRVSADQIKTYAITGLFTNGWLNLSGSVSGTPTTYSCLAGSSCYDVNHIVVSPDTMAAGGNTSGPSGLGVTHNFGSGSFTGNAVGIVSYLTQLSTTGNSNAQYVGQLSIASANAPDTNGAMFSGNDNTFLGNGATGWLQLVGREIDVGVVASASVQDKLGLQIVQTSIDATMGSRSNIGITFNNGNAAGATGWDCAICIGGYAGNFPMSVNGTIMSGWAHAIARGSGVPSANAGTTLNGIDFSNITFTGSPFKSTGFNIGPSGKLTLSGTPTTFTIEPNGTTGSINGSTISQAIATDHSLWTSGSFIRPNYFQATLTPSGNTTNIWENFTSAVILNGPGQQQQEINNFHGQITFNTGALSTSATENYEARMDNSGSISQFVHYLTLPTNNAGGVITASLYGMKCQLVNNNGTAGSIAVNACIDQEPWSGSGSIPTFHLFLRGADPAAYSALLGHLNLGQLGDAGIPLYIKGSNTSGATLAIKIADSSANNLFQMANDGTVITNGGAGWSFSGGIAVTTKTQSASFQAGTSALTLSNGEVGLNKITATGVAAGAAGGKFELVCGTAGGSAKLIAYAGTSTTPVTIVDNIGSGVTGC